jgi:hypothetical protein
VIDLEFEDPRDALHFQVGMSIVVTSHRPWWRRLWAFLRRPWAKPRATHVVTHVDPERGLVTVESSCER